MSPGDIRYVKRLADRLQVRDSDIIRFAVKSALTRLAPLCEEQTRGNGLMPMLIETSADLFRHLDLDLARLEAVVNGDVEDASKRVDSDDLRMMAMHGMHSTFSMASLSLALPTGSSDGASRPEFGPGTFETALKRYLYDKYVARTARASTGGGDG
jgi:hypothetical protein